MTMVKFWTLIFLLLMSLGSLLYYWMLSSLSCEMNETSFDTKMINECDDRQRISSKTDIIRANNASYDRLLYNRVPKCGSTTLVSLLKHLSKHNHFIHISAKVYDQRRLGSEQQETLITQLLRSPTPLSYDRHIYYIDFGGHEAGDRVVYINLIREPVERIASSFYYRRSVAINSSSRVTPSSSWLNKSFDSCVLNKDPECSPDNWYTMSMVPYFCGQHDRCLRMNDEWALRMAKRNIEASYAVVGILEHINITLHVLAQVVHKFFAGVSLFYDLKKPIVLNRNPNKLQVSQRAKAKLRNDIDIEYQLYEYCRQRLFAQFRQIKTSKNDNR